MCVVTCIATVQYSRPGYDVSLLETLPLLACHHHHHHHHPCLQTPTPRTPTPPAEVHDAEEPAWQMSGAPRPVSVANTRELGREGDGERGKGPDGG